MKINFKNLLKLLGSILIHISSTIWHYIRMYVHSVYKRIRELWNQIVTIVTDIVNRR